MRPLGGETRTRRAISTRSKKGPADPGSMRTIFSKYLKNICPREVLPFGSLNLRGKFPTEISREVRERSGDPGTSSRNFF